MKKALFLLVILISFYGNSQTNKYKNKIIYSKGLGVNYVEISMRENLDENNNVVSKIFILKLQDVNYIHITNRIECFSGNSEEFIKFMDVLNTFYKENETDVFMDYGNLNLRRAKYGVGITFKDKIGEIGFYFKDFEKLKTTVENNSK